MDKEILSVEEETLRRMARVERYHQWLLEKMQPHLGETILEAGCGTGNITRELLSRGRRVIASDISPQYIEMVKAEFNHHDGFEAVACDLSEPAAMDLAKYQPDTVVCLNVLEHITDDRRALTTMHAVLRPGGKLILFVPALPALYGTLDKALEHQRRYSRKPLMRLLREIGFESVEGGYMNFPGLFGWFLNSRILKRQILPEGQLLLYNRLVPVFRFIDRILGPPVGQSLFLICRKGA